MAKLQTILLGLGIIGVILLSPVVFLSFIGVPCPFLPPDIQIDIHRTGPEEWLPVVKELESFVPTLVPLPPYWHEGEYTINITAMIEQYQQGPPGTVVRGNYNMTYDISHNASHLHEFIHDLTFNESAWRYWLFDPPYCNLSWIYSSEYDTTFQYETITDPTNFKATLEQYLQNFSTTLAEQEAFLYVVQELAFARSRRTCLLTPAMGIDFPHLGRLLLTTTTGRVAAIMVMYFHFVLPTSF